VEPEIIVLCPLHEYSLLCRGHRREKKSLTHESQWVKKCRFIGKRVHAKFFQYTT
jgi:hypothetical protein